MEKFLKILSEEHQNILKVIEALLKECEVLELEKGRKIDENFFKKTIEFIKNYADKFHHIKEEDILFAELSKGEASMLCNPVNQMLYEHDLGRKFVKNLENGVKENNKAKILKSAREYAQLLQDHIFKEDNILYPMADETLNQKNKKILSKKFEEAEQKFIQEKNKYLSFIKEN